MAQRRMFSLKIVDTDKFLEMPISARCLYYDLSMRADDEGFVSSPKKIINMVGASIDDFKLLCAKEYIIPFESGVIVIKDWKIHNYIQNDRVQETHYKDEISQLAIDGNKSYVKCIQNVSMPMDTQVRLGKDRIGKVRLGENKTLTRPSPEEVQAYLDERGIKAFTGQYFVDKNDSIGWVVGKNRSPMKDWRAAVRTWEKYPNNNIVKKQIDVQAELDKWAKYDEEENGLQATTNGNHNILR